MTVVSNPLFTALAVASEEHFTMEGDVMWVGSGTRRNGYLIFNCATLEDPTKDPTAQKYTMTFKFSQVGYHYYQNFE